MSLFTINRYMGDRSEDAKTEHDNVHNILKNIHLQARLRERSGKPVLDASPNGTVVKKDILQKDNIPNIQVDKRKRPLESDDDSSNESSILENVVASKRRKVKTPSKQKEKNPSSKRKMSDADDSVKKKQKKIQLSPINVKIESDDESSILENVVASKRGKVKTPSKQKEKNPSSKRRMSDADDSVKKKQKKFQHSPIKVKIEVKTSINKSKQTESSSEEETEVVTTAQNDNSFDDSAKLKQKILKKSPIKVEVKTPVKKSKQTVNNSEESNKADKLISKKGLKKNPISLADQVRPSENSKIVDDSAELKHKKAKTPAKKLIQTESISNEENNYAKKLISKKSPISSIEQVLIEENTEITDDVKLYKGTPEETNDDEDSRHEAKSEEGDYQQNKDVGGFTIIGDVKKVSIEKVQRVLPNWLANPSIVNNNLRDANVGLDCVHGLDEELLTKLRENGINHFFPVQRLVIPVLLSGQLTSHLIGPAGYRPSDICCSAPTGSGKTLAFVLPIVQALRHRVVRRVRALVVLPVRDLAAQVYKVFTTYCNGTNIKVVLLTGQKGFQTEQQHLICKGPRGLQVQADIVVATPGRLVDHIKDTNGFDLHHLRYLVIDEADRMMNNIKQDWLSHVEQAVYGGDCSRQRPVTLSAATASRLEIPLQKLLFSATLSQNPEKLQQLNLFQPKLFTAVVKRSSSPAINHLTSSNKGETVGENGEELKKGDFVGKFTTPTGLSEYMVVARDAGEKPLLVLYFLHQRMFRHVLVFTNSVDATHRLYHLIKLVGGLRVAEFSSNLHAMHRSKIIKKFASGKIDVLICSDAMARGMDIENVQCVLSYDSAPYIKTYIHRIGRTARAGKVGTAFTLLENKEVSKFKQMVQEAGKQKVEELKIPKNELRGLVSQYQRALEELPAKLQSEKKNR